MNFLFPILIVLGFSGLVLAVYLFFRLQDALLHSTYVEGTVSSLISSPGSRGRANHRIVVDYLDLTGRALSITSTVASSPPMANVGQRVRVAIETNTGKARIVLFFELYFGLLMQGVFSLLGLLVGLWKVGLPPYW